MLKKSHSFSNPVHHSSFCLLYMSFIANIKIYISGLFYVAVTTKYQKNVSRFNCNVFELKLHLSFVNRTVECPDLQSEVL